MPRAPASQLETSGGVSGSGVDTRVSLGPGVREHVRAEGGSLCLRARSTTCCSGALVFFETSLGPPSPSVTRTWQVEGIDVHLIGSLRLWPDEIEIELRGRRRIRLAAYFDGCAYRI